MQKENSKKPRNIHPVLAYFWVQQYANTGAAILCLVEK